MFNFQKIISCKNQNQPEEIQLNNSINPITKIAQQQFESLASYNGVLLDDFCKNHTITEIGIRDLNAMVELINKFHPAMVDSSQSHEKFKYWLAEGYLQAKKRLEEVGTFEGYQFALKSFIAGFKDGHFNFYTMNKPTVRWPGFLLKFLNGKYIIDIPKESLALKDLPPNGAEVIACNGKHPSVFLHSNLFPYSVKDPAVESSVFHLTPKLLIDEGNPWAEKIETITYRVNNELVTSNLNWIDISSEKADELSYNTVCGKRPDFAIREFGSNGIWISIPTFSNRFEGDRKLPEIIKKLPSLRDKNPIVFDIRGNGGGSSGWVVGILMTLYGEEYLSSLNIRNSRSLADDRVNEELMQMKLKTHPENYMNDFKACVDKGMAFFRRETDTHFFSKLKRSDKEYSNPVKGKVYLLTDSHCFSSGLIFADSILSIPGVTHIGMTTDADTQFSMPVPLKLSSGISQIGCPTMIRRFWDRGDNEPFIPKIKFEGDIEDTKGLEDWILKLDPLELRKL